MATQFLSVSTSQISQPFSYSIAHSSAGRIRLRIPYLDQYPDYADGLERSLSTCPGVFQVSINLLACSVTVCYSPRQVSAREFQEQLIAALQQATVPPPSTCTTKALAQRLGVPFQTLNWRRSQVDFAQWSRSRDPQSITWSYDPESKCFSACRAAVIHANEPSAKVERIYHALTEAAGGHVGGTVGRVTGEVLGLALLGPGGAIVGAEIGTVVGEIVGGELGTA
jgi:hypothetical protein